MFEATHTSINYKFIRNSDGSIGDDFWIINDIEKEIPIDKPNNSNNSIKTVQEETLIDQIKELKYTGTPLTIAIIAITAIFNLKRQKR